MPALDADEAFFSALLDADRHALDALLTDDFVLVDVMAGGVIARDDLIEVVGGGQMVFEDVQRPSAPSVRCYGETAVVVGETRMRGRFGDDAFAAHSRYTHVLVRAGGAWRLASAQGTQIAPQPT